MGPVPGFTERFTEAEITPDPQLQTTTLAADNPGRSCAPPIRSSASTARWAAAPTLSASSPTTAPRSRLAASIVIEQNGEWLVGHRYLSARSLGRSADDFRRPDRLITREAMRMESASQ